LGRIDIGKVVDRWDYVYLDKRDENLHMVFTEAKMYVFKYNREGTMIANVQCQRFA